MDKVQEVPANGQPEVTPEPRATAATAGGSAQVVRHSPLPWNVGQYYRADILSSSGRVVDGGGFGIPQREADAAFIVQACNNHYSLIETVRQLRDAHREMFALMGTLVEAMDEILPDVPMTVSERSEAEKVIADARTALAAVAAKFA